MIKSALCGVICQTGVDEDGFASSMMGIVCLDEMLKHILTGLFPREADTAISCYTALEGVMTCMACFFSATVERGNAACKLTWALFSTRHLSVQVDGHQCPSNYQW